MVLKTIINKITTLTKMVLFGPAGWVINQSRGMPQIVSIKNYAGHKESKNRRADHFGKFLHS